MGVGTRVSLTAGAACALLGVLAALLAEPTSVGGQAATAGTNRAATAAREGGPANRDAAGNHYVMSVAGSGSGAPLAGDGLSRSAGYPWNAGYTWNEGQAASPGHDWSAGYTWSSGYRWTKRHPWSKDFAWSKSVPWLNAAVVQPAAEALASIAACIAAQ